MERKYNEMMRRAKRENKLSCCGESNLTTTTRTPRKEWTVTLQVTIGVKHNKCASASHVCPRPPCCFEYSYLLPLASWLPRLVSSMVFFFFFSVHSSRVCFTGACLVFGFWFVSRWCQSAVLVTKEVDLGDYQETLLEMQDVVQVCIPLYFVVGDVTSVRLLFVGFVGIGIDDLVLWRCWCGCLVLVGPQTCRASLLSVFYSYGSPNSWGLHFCDKPSETSLVISNLCSSVVVVCGFHFVLWSLSLTCRWFFIESDRRVRVAAGAVWVGALSVRRCFCAGRGVGVGSVDHQGQLVAGRHGLVSARPHR